MDQDKLRRLQLVELDMLKKIDFICNDNGLRYYLVGGTLLGAVRHKGFIPWDDDLDIAMPRKDYNKFILLCNNGILGEEYYLHHISTDPEYWLSFAKIKKNNTIFDEANYKNLNCHKGIFIDVFPLDYCPKNKGVSYHLRAKLIKKISVLIYMRKIPSASISLLQCTIIKLSKVFSIKQLAKIRDRICSRYTDGKYIINYGSNYKYTKQTMPKEYYEPAKRLQFEDRLFCVPNQYIKFLEHLFKNWNELPPEEERRNHNPARILFDATEEGI